MQVPYEGIYFRINFKTKVNVLIVLYLYSLKLRSYKYVEEFGPIKGTI